VVCVDVLEHIPEWQQAIAEIARVAAQRAYIEVTPVEDEANFLEDPTHCAWIGINEWLVEVKRHFDVRQILSNRGFLCWKERRVEVAEPTPILVEAAKPQRRRKVKVQRDDNATNSEVLEMQLAASLV